MESIDYRGANTLVSRKNIWVTIIWRVVIAITVGSTNLDDHFNKEKITRFEKHLYLYSEMTNYLDVLR